MGDPSDVSEARSKLGRLHSLLFGTDVALANDDYETSLGLGLRLAGFLASELNTSDDEVYFRNILRHAHDNIGFARQATESDRYVLEQAKCPAGFQFSTGRPIDPERVRRSKYLGDIFSSTGTLQKEPEPSSARGSIEQLEPSSATIGATLQPEPSSESIGMQLDQSSATTGATLQPEPCSEFRSAAGPKLRDNWSDGATGPKLSDHRSDSANGAELGLNRSDIATGAKVSEDRSDSAIRANNTVKGSNSSSKPGLQLSGKKRDWA